MKLRRKRRPEFRACMRCSLHFLCRCSVEYAWFWGRRLKTFLKSPAVTVACKRRSGFSWNAILNQSLRFNTKLSWLVPRDCTICCVCVPYAMVQIDIIKIGNHFKNAKVVVSTLAKTSGDFTRPSIPQIYASRSPRSWHLAR